MKSPYLSYIAATNLAGADHATLSDGFDRGFRENQRKASVLENDRRLAPTFDGVDEVLDFSVECFPVALDEEMKVGLRPIGQPIGINTRLMRAAVLGNRHAGGSESLDALIVSIDRPS